MTFPSEIAIPKRDSFVPIRLSLSWLWPLWTLGLLSLWPLLGSQPLLAQTSPQFKEVEAYAAGLYINQDHHSQGTYSLVRTGERVTATLSTNHSLVPRVASLQTETLFTVPQGFRPATVIMRMGDGIPVHADGTLDLANRDVQHFWLRVEPSGAVRYVGASGTEGGYRSYTISLAWATTAGTGDRMALEALIAGGGEGWLFADNWGRQDVPLGEWEGVITNAAGRVTRVVRGVTYDMGGMLPAELGDLTALEVLGLNWAELHGPIPPVLGQLSALRVLDLSENLLDGPIPLELTHLKSLEVLDLWQNQLAGAIPPELAQMPALQELQLGHNQLSEAIPPELSQMQTLRELHLAENQLSGPIPRELGQMQSLEVLYLYDNQLSGVIPPELGQMQALQKLTLARNQLSGPIPRELGQMQSLEVLYLYDNQLSGVIPPELGQMQALQKLSLARNQLGGAIPPELGQLQSLQELDLWTNQLNGTIPMELGQLKELNRLILGRNTLVGAIPPALGQIHELQELNLIGNLLWGPIPIELGRFAFWYEKEIIDEFVTGCRPWTTNCLADTQSVEGDRAALMALYAATQGDAWLHKDNWGQPDVPLAQWFGVTTDSQGRVTHLELSANYLQGDLPSDMWASLGRLRVLDLSDNQLRGLVPWTFRWNFELRRLSLAQNQLSGRIPPALLNFPRALEVLDLGMNQLVGIFPKGCGLPALKVLVLKDNLLSGTLPMSVDCSPVLEVLDLEKNQFSGTIPVHSDWYKPYGRYPFRRQFRGHGYERGGLDFVYALKSLDLSHNQLTGPLPPTLGGLDALQRLDLGNNQLEGPLPAYWGLLAAIRELDLRDNQLNGHIPPELGRLDFATGFPRLHGNRFTGCVPWPVDSYTGGHLPSCFTETYSVEQDRAALLLLFEATQGTDWQRNDNWGRSEVPLDQWHGVTTDSKGRVTHLELVGLGLRGILPLEPWNSLSELRVLELDQNRLSGPIPWSVSWLRNLQRLSLAGNRFSGTIPPVLGRLEALEVLDLGHNELRGIIPPALGQLQALKVLDLGSNRLSAIVSEYNVERGSSIPWAIPEELAQLKELQILDLAHNNLYGNIPSELGQLQLLRSVNLEGNSWIGNVPPAWNGILQSVDEPQG